MPFSMPRGGPRRSLGSLGGLRSRGSPLGSPLGSPGGKEGKGLSKLAPGGGRPPAEGLLVVDFEGPYTWFTYVFLIVFAVGVFLQDQEGSLAGHRGQVVVRIQGLEGPVGASTEAVTAGVHMVPNPQN